MLIFPQYHLAHNMTAHKLIPMYLRSTPVIITSTQSTLQQRTHPGPVPRYPHYLYQQPMFHYQHPTAFGELCFLAFFCNYFVQPRAPWSGTLTTSHVPLSAELSLTLPRASSCYLVLPRTSSCFLVLPRATSCYLMSLVSYNPPSPQFRTPVSSPLHSLLPALSLLPLKVAKVCHCQISSYILYLLSTVHQTYHL